MVAVNLEYSKSPLRVSFKMRKIWIVSIYIVCSVGIGFLVRCENKRASDLEEQQQLLQLLGASLTATPTCNIANPAFSTLATAGTTSRCQSCHSGGSPSGGMDITSQAQVKARTSPGDARGSYLYQKITVGSMAINSNTAINNAVYCWIQGGSNP